MRILLISQYYYPEPISVARIAEDLKSRGHEVEVLTGLPNYGFGRIVEGYENVKEENINGVKVMRVRLYPRKGGALSIVKNYLSFWHNAKKAVKRLGDYDIVYGISMSPIMSVSCGGKYAKKHKVPFLIHCYDLWPESAVAAGYVKKKGLLYRLIFHWSKKIYESADEVLISSPSFANYFREVLKTRVQTKVIYQPPVEIDPSSQIISLPHKTNLIYAGNFGKLQRVENFVRAMKYISIEDDIHLYLLGKGAMEEEIKRIIRDNSLEDKVSLLGLLPQKEALSYLRSGTAIIVPLLSGDSLVSDTIPSKLVTSLASSKPIIGALGGVSRKILEEAKGSFFTSFGPKEISECYKRINASSIEELEKLGKNNLHYYQEHFQFAKVMDSLEEELKSFKKS